MKILVIRFSSLGDVVLTLPIFRALKQALPGAVIVALTKKSFADALQGSSATRCLTLDPGQSLWNLIRLVRREKCDAVLDLHGSLRSRIVSLFSGAPRRVCYQKAILARRLFVGWRIPAPELERHTLDRYWDALEKLVPQAGRPPKRALVIQTAFLGDAVLTTPLLSALRQQLPDTTIDVLCTPEVADVFKGHPSVKELILFNKRGEQKSFNAQWRLAKSLTSRHYDLAVIPHRSLTSALLAWGARIPRRIGFSTSQGRWLLTDVVPFEWGTHDVDRNLALLKPLGGAGASGTLWLKPDSVTLESVRDRLLAAGIHPTDRLLGINAGSVWATKRWLPEGFAAVADRVSQELGVKILFIGAPKDKPVVESVIRQMKQPAVNWTGETALAELIAAISRCNAFLTNDSGPMHIAVASNVPTVAIFGPTTKELGFFPYGPGHTVIEKDLNCRPCGLHGHNQCPLGHFQCMKTITPDEVFVAVKEKFLLSSSSVSSSSPSSPASVSGGPIGSRTTTRQDDGSK